MFSSRTLKKVSKNAGKTIVTIIVVLYLTVNVLFRSQNNNQPILVSDKSYWDALDQVGVDGKFYTKLLPYNVIPVTEEILRQESTAWWSPVVRGPTRRTKLLHERRGEAFGTPVLIQEALFQSEIHYLRRSVCLHVDACICSFFFIFVCVFCVFSSCDFVYANVFLFMYICVLFFTPFLLLYSCVFWYLRL